MPLLPAAAGRQNNHFLVGRTSTQDKPSKLCGSGRSLKCACPTLNEHTVWTERHRSCCMLMVVIYVMHIIWFFFFNEFYCSKDKQLSCRRVKLLTSWYKPRTYPTNYANVWVGTRMDKVFPNPQRCWQCYQLIEQLCKLPTTQQLPGSLWQQTFSFCQFAWKIDATSFHSFNTLKQVNPYSESIIVLSLHSITRITGFTCSSCGWRLKHCQEVTIWTGRAKSVMIRWESCSRNAAMFELWPSIRFQLDDFQECTLVYDYSGGFLAMEGG